MSKNNTQEMQKKMMPQRQRFTLRKLSIGVASVLLGTTFLVGTNTVHAATDTQDANPDAVSSINSGSQDGLTSSEYALRSTSEQNTANQVQPVNNTITEGVQALRR